MKENLNKFNKLLEKFRFKEPLPEKVQDDIERYKKQDLINVLKKFGRYSIIFAIILKIFHYGKTLGIKITIVQSKIIFAALSFLTVAAFSTGVVYTYKAIISNDKKEKIEKEERIEQEGKEISVINKNKTENQKQKKETPEEQIFQVGIKDFSSAIADKKLLYNITERITGRLTTILGAGIKNIKNIPAGAKVNKLVTGSVEKLGSTYIITARLIDPKTSKVIFVATEDAESEESINRACINIVEKISGNITHEK